MNYFNDMHPILQPNAMWRISITGGCFTHPPKTVSTIRSHINVELLFQPDTKHHGFVLCLSRELPGSEPGCWVSPVIVDLSGDILVLKDDASHPALSPFCHTQRRHRWEPFTELLGLFVTVCYILPCLCFCLLSLLHFKLWYKNR